jgi:hypothetical protein
VLRSEGSGLLRKVLLALFGLFVASVGIYLAVKFIRQPKGREMVSPDGQRYMQAPQYEIREPEGFSTLIHVSALAESSPERIKVVLSNELGPAAWISSQRIAGYEHWVATIFTPVLRNSNTRIEVLPYKNRVVFIKFKFEARYPNRAEMLILLGLMPHMAPPTLDAMEGPKWTSAFPGVDEVSGVYHPKGGPGIREVTVTPNKALANYFFRGGQ